MDEDETLYAVYMVMVESTEEAFLELTGNSGIVSWSEVARDIKQAEAEELVNS